MADGKPVSHEMHDQMLALFETLALEAGKRILEIRTAGAAVETKADNSPVTQADQEAEEIILAGLGHAYPEIACVAEEAVSRGEFEAVGPRAFFLVDPLDGTKEFIKGSTDFTVNIAYVEAGVPLVGMVYAPALGLLYSGAPGRACEAAVEGFRITGRRPIRVRACGSVPSIVASRSHLTTETRQFIERYDKAETTSIGSSLKFCLLAAGKADLYPRFGRTMEWDTAAGDAVLRAAGGQTLGPTGTPLVYGKCVNDDAPYANPHFIALTDVALAEPDRSKRDRP